MRHKLLLLFPSALIFTFTHIHAQCSACFGSATNFPVGANPYAVVSADFNNDGNMDLAAANWSSSTVSVLLGNGLGNFGSATNFSVGTNPRSLVTADFNTDGNMDLATGNDGSNNVSVLLGNGNGTFAGAVNYSVAPAPEA